MVAEPHYLLAMKCLAMCLGAEFHDEEDVRFLLRLLNLPTYKQSLEIIGRYYPLERTPRKTLCALEELLPRSAVGELDHFAGLPMTSDWLTAWFTRVHRFVFHRTNGRIGGKLGNIPMALMYTIGAKTGQVRMIPLQCYPVEPEGVLVLASNNGRSSHPGWYYNLRAHPEIDALVGGERRRVRAEELSAERRATEWPEMLRQNRSIEDYEARAGGRELPIFLLRTLNRT